MLKTVEGIYRGGLIELKEVPPSAIGPTEVLVTFLDGERRRDQSRVDRRAEIEAICRHCQGLPDRDLRSADEILGYDERGLP